MRKTTVSWNKGVVVRSGEARIVLDAVAGCPLAEDSHVFVTHAHADHMYSLRSKARKYATPETFEIYKQISQRQILNEVPLKTGDKIRIDDITITSLNAGHMLGSVQFLIELPEKTILYTGDINCINTLTTDKADVAQCDELVMEATYGNPFFVFPPRQFTYAKIVEWATRQAINGHVPTFRVYAAGKAQEVIRIINEYTSLKVLTCSSVSRVNEAHLRHGMNLEYSDLETGGIHDQPAVCIATYARNVQIPENSVKALATGWAVGSRARDIAFPLSSHADFSQLVDYVSSTNAKKVYVYTGCVAPFCNYLGSKMGISASSLPTLQGKLADFDDTYFRA